MSNHVSTAAIFGRYVREQRERRHWSRPQLAAKSGMSAQYVGLLERGVHSPSVDTLLRIAYALGISGAEALKTVEEMVAAARKN